MSLKLKKSAFSRNHDREKNVGDIFNKTSTRLNLLQSLAVSAFFTPALMATSLFSHEIVLMLINISLSLGYLTNFGYRIFQKEVGKAELLLTLSVLALFIAGACYLFPMVLTSYSFFNVIALINQSAVGINLFFLLKNSIVPPILGWFKYLAAKMGHVIQEQYYQTKPLDIKEDACIVNALLKKHFNHSLYEGSVEDDLKKLNQVLQILTDYINKYDETVLGDMHYQQVIKEIEDHITQLTVKGNADSSFSFIKRKLAYKEVKLNWLKQAKSDLDDKTHPRWDKFSSYCSGMHKSDYDKEPRLFHQQASQLLDEEIKRQQGKYAKLSECLP